MGQAGPEGQTTHVKPQPNSEQPKPNGVYNMAFLRMVNDPDQRSY